MLAAAPPFPYEYDPATRARARAYERGSRRLGLVGGTLYPVGLALALWVSGASRALADAAASMAGGSLALSDTLYILAFGLLFAVATLPVAAYSGFLRERRWGMTRRRPRDFALDALKGVILGVLFALALLLPFFYLVRHESAWWLFAAALYGAYLVGASVVLPHVVLPLFYKVEPLAEGPVRDAIFEVAARAGLPAPSRVVVMKESPKSPRANAFIHGLGRTRRVVLFDTLLRAFHPREVRFIVAHELAHLKHRDVPKHLALTLAAVFPEMWVVRLALEGGGFAFGVRGPPDVAVVPLLLAVVSALSLLDRVAFSWLSRRTEAQADAFALRVTEDSTAAESMMKRMCDLNLLDDSPHPLLERLLYSHPAPRRRIDAARAFAARPPAARPTPPGPAPP